MIERTYDEDPNRCQGIVAGKAQCINKAEMGSRFCLVHGGDKGYQSMQKQNANNYRLTRFAGRVEEFAKNDSIKSLREEIGIMRLLVEERMNACATPADLLIQSGAISDLVMKMERLVISCHKMEDSLGKYIDAEAILDFAQRIIKVLGTHLEGDLLRAVSDDILKEIGN